MTLEQQLKHRELEANISNGNNILAIEWHLLVKLRALYLIEKGKNPNNYTINQQYFNYENI